MDGLSTKDLVGVILGIIFPAVIVFARFGSRPRVPKDKFFNCWRCKALTLHTGAPSRHGVTTKRDCSARYATENGCGPIRRGRTDRDKPP